MLRSAKCPVILWCKIALILVFLQISLGVDVPEDENHQALVHLGRIEKPGYWTFVEDSDSHPSGVLPFARLGRNRLFKLPQTLIPYPRTGRELFDTDIFDYEDSMVPDFAWHNLADGSMEDFFLSGKSLIPKRAVAAFPPRFGRKKRSLSDENEGMEREESDGAMVNSRSSELSLVNKNINKRMSSTIVTLKKVKKGKSKNTFIPRVGKRATVVASKGERATILTNTAKRAITSQRILSERLGKLFVEFPRARGTKKKKGDKKPIVISDTAHTAFVPSRGKRATTTNRTFKTIQHKDISRFQKNSKDERGIPIKMKYPNISSYETMKKRSPENSDVSRNAPKKSKKKFNGSIYG